MAHDVFISYSSHDKAVADAVCATLEQRKIRCWIAPRDVLAGTSWSASIVKAIAASKVMVLIFSGNANQSEQIKREVERAVNKAIPILPFRIEKVLPSADLEYFLSVPHWLDAMNPPLETHLKSLADTVTKLISDPGGGVAAPTKPAPAPVKRRTLRPWAIAVVVGLFVMTLCGVGLWAAISKIVSAYREANPSATVTNSIGMKLVLLPAGEFGMGVEEAPKAVRDEFPPGELPSTGDDRPVRTVRITKPYYMGAYEVTVGQFREFVTASKHRTQTGSGINMETLELEGHPRYTWQNAGFPQTDDHPVVNVSWFDAVEFCAWLSKKEGVTYRLPTEAEWEYACRAGSDTYYGHGNNVKDLEGYGNFADLAFEKKMPRWFEQNTTWKPTPWNDGYPFTAPVGMFRPNAFGLYDMHGNVTEYCADWYDPRAYHSGETENPSGPAIGTNRIQRGGSWMEPALRSGVAYRWPAPPGLEYLTAPDFACSNHGFRVVREVGR